ncbi:MAG: hypothetical protein WB493_03160 [Anaeromyxobacteraceae bacterium]
MTTSSAQAAVRHAIDEYFAGERRDALVFTLLGAANLGAALTVLLAVPDQRLLALALATIGLLEIVPGFWAIRRQAARHADALARQRSDPEGWKAEEAERVARVLDARRRLRIADAVFVLAFVVVVVLAPPGERLAWLAVPGQMALLPLLNVAMERRTRRFAAALAAS